MRKAIYIFIFLFLIHCSFLTSKDSYCEQLSITYQQALKSEFLKLQKKEIFYSLEDIHIKNRDIIQQITQDWKKPLTQTQAFLHDLFLSFKTDVYLACGYLSLETQNTLPIKDGESSLFIKCAFRHWPKLSSSHIQPLCKKHFSF